MASFDKGHSADAAHLPHVGSSNQHFPCQSDWYILSMLFSHVWKMMRAREMSLKQRMTPPPPHIDLFVLVEWQVLHEDRVGFDCLRVWSEPTPSSLTVRFCARCLLMNGSARRRSPEAPVSVLSATTVDQRSSSDYSSLFYSKFLILRRAEGATPDLDQASNGIKRQMRGNSFDLSQKSRPFFMAQKFQQ